MTIAVKNPSPVLRRLQALDVSGRWLDFLERNYRAAGRMVHRRQNLAQPNHNLWVVGFNTGSSDLRTTTALLS